MGCMSHTERLCWGRRAPASQCLLPVYQGALLGWVLPLANQQLTPDIISWEELGAKEGCQEELPARAAALSPAWRQSRGRAPATVPGWHPLCLPPSPGTPQRNVVPSKTSAIEPCAVLVRGRARQEDLLAFVFTMREIFLAVSIALGSPEFSQTCCLELG